jgi:hypothetical protein
MNDKIVLNDYGNVDDFDVDAPGKHQMSLQGHSDATNSHIISDERDDDLDGKLQTESELPRF